MITHVQLQRELLIQRISFPLEMCRVRNRLSKSGGIVPAAYFNPSIVKYGDALWMSYRVEADPLLMSSIASVRMNVRFEPQYTTNKVLPLQSRWNGQSVEDMRLFEHGPELWGIYNDGGRMWLSRFDSELNLDMSVQAETDFKQQSIEKNWTFFSYGKSMYCIYLCAPEHVILEQEWAGCQIVMCKKHSVPWTPKWEYGDIRGGAPAIMHNGVFYHFFHSWTEDPVFQRRYHVGVYTFDSKPPFKPIAITKAPLFSAPYHSVPKEKLFSVVFPGGSVRVDGGWKLSYGLHDWECCIASIPDEDISLVEV